MGLISKQLGALGVLLGLLFSIVFGSSFAVAETRLALVIGNSKYPGAAALENPVNDASDLSQILRREGFDVIEVHDAAREGMVNALRDFSGRVHDVDVALFYYAGHGLQLKGENYLVPIDAKIENETDVRFNTISLGDIQQEIGSARNANIIILDACRNNPFTEALVHGARGTATRGLEPIQAAGVGSLVVFSTQPDNVSLDGHGRNSPFASALLKYVGTPGLEIRQMISKVRGDVLQATDRKQVPWDNSSLIGDVYLASASAEPTEKPLAAPVDLSVQALASAHSSSQPHLSNPEQSAGRETLAPAVECERLASPPPPFATPAQIQAASNRDWASVLPVCQAAVTANASDPKLQYFLGLAFDNTKNYLEAAHYYTLSSNTAYPPAEDGLGVLFANGRGVVKDNLRALDLFNKAVASGYPNSFNNLGAMYSNGAGVKEDDAKALALFEKAIEAGNSFGLAQAGIMYFNGKGTERSYPAAAQYFQQSADLGSGYAMKFLAIMYERGLLGKPDPAKAAELRLRAAQVAPNSSTPEVPFPRKVAHVVHAAQRRVVVIRRYRFFRLHVGVVLEPFPDTLTRGATR